MVHLQRMGNTTLGYRDRTARFLRYLFSRRTLCFSSLFFFLLQVSRISFTIADWIMAGATAVIAVMNESNLLSSISSLVRMGRSIQKVARVAFRQIRGKKTLKECINHPGTRSLASLMISRCRLCGTCRLSFETLPLAH